MKWVNKKQPRLGLKANSRLSDSGSKLFRAEWLGELQRIGELQRVAWTGNTGHMVFPCLKRIHALQPALYILHETLHTTFPFF